jgi:hypothetical protein
VMRCRRGTPVVFRIKTGIPDRQRTAPPCAGVLYGRCGGALHCIRDTPYRSHSIATKSSQIPEHVVAFAATMPVISARATFRNDTARWKSCARQ